jgi:hypothetical protein
MSGAGKAETIVLGDEYDDELRSAILEVLREMGANQESKSSGVGGSQELETLSVRVGERVIVIEAYSPGRSEDVLYEPPKIARAHSVIP